jgi:hypothetical protein
MVVAFVQPVDWLFSATLRRAAGQETTSYFAGVEEQAGSAFTRSRETVNPGTRGETRLIHS